METFSDQSQERLVGQPFLEQLHEKLSVKLVEEGDDVCFQNDPYLAAMNGLADGTEGIMGTTARTVAVRA